MKTLCSLILILALALPVSAMDYRSGAAGAQFLKLGVGSRYLGVADAAVATSNDAYAAYWNPAGLALIENWSLAFTNVDWLLDIDLNYFAAARNFEGVGVFATSVTVLSAPDQEITTVEEQDGTGKYYTASSYAVGFSFARQLTHRFAFGATFKYIGEEIGDVDSRGIAFDFGTLLYTGVNSLTIGMSMTNMGPDLRFTGNSLKVPYDDGSGNPVDAELKANEYNLPLTFRVGMAYDIEFNTESIVTLSAELTDPNDGEQRGSLGAEFGYSEQYFLRGGYKFKYDEETFALGGGLSAPIGEETRLVIDYAWQDFGRLESSQRFSIGFTF